MIVNHSKNEIENKVFSAQKNWANYIVEIGKQRSDTKKTTILVNQFIEELYAFKKAKVLFKPTKAKVIPFRRTVEEFISYFIASNNVP